MPSKLVIRDPGSTPSLRLPSLLRLLPLSVLLTDAFYVSHFFSVSKFQFVDIIFTGQKRAVLFTLVAANYAHLDS